MQASSLRSRLGYAAVLIASLGLFGHQLARYLKADFIEDDAFISLRYARRLLEGRGLTWNDGERVEGYSNLLWVLCETALGAMGVDWFVATRVLGFAGMGMAFVALAWYFRPGRAGGLLPGAFALGAFSISTPLVVCTASGLETPFMVGFVCLAFAALDRSLEGQGASALRWAAAAGLPLGLLAINRPDGMLFSVAFALGVILVGGLGSLQRKRLALMAIGPGLLFGSQLAFRLVYYRDWVPNTAHAKLGDGADRTAEGVAYVLDGLEYQYGIWLFAFLALMPLLRQGPSWTRRGVLLVLPFLVLWTAYLVYTGGVWPLARRWLTPTLLGLLLLGGLGLVAAVSWLRTHPRFRVVSLLLPLAVVVSLAWLHTVQWRDPQVNRAIHYDFHWKKKGLLFQDVFGRAFASKGQPYLALNVAGAIPFYLDWPALDMLGLLDRWIATHPPADPAWALSGHTMGDGVYVLDRQPDIVLFGVHHGSWGGVLTSGRQMHADPRFHEQYRYVELVREDPPSARIRVWVRLASELVGVEREAGRVEIPAWFFAAEEDSILKLADELVLPLGPGARATATGIALEPGRWSVQPRFTVPGGAWELTVSGPEDLVVEPTSLTLPTGGTVDLGVALSVHAEATRLASVVLERVPFEVQPADDELPSATPSLEAL